MKHNLYDERRKEARKLQKLINDSPYRKKVVYAKPVWNGDYQIKWILNPKHESHPEAETARGLIHLIPKQVVSSWEYHRQKKYKIAGLDGLLRLTEVRISEDEYFALTERQRKFFTNGTGHAWYAPKDSPSIVYTDYRGRIIYKMKFWEFGYFYTPVLVKHRIKSEWVRVEKPEHVKWMDKLYRTGFGNRYLFNEHHSDPWKRADEMEVSRKLCRLLQYQINQGIEDYYAEKEGTSCRGIIN
jgi:hypothetical protein